MPIRINGGVPNTPRSPRFLCHRVAGARALETVAASRRCPTMSRFHLHHEGLTALKFAAVGGLGFLTDISVLHLCLHALRLSPFVGRAISLTCAMQVTFLVNGLVVFCCLDWKRWPRQWLGYMATNGLGNLINYLVFAGLIGSSLPPGSP